MPSPCRLNGPAGEWVLPVADVAHGHRGGAARCLRVFTRTPHGPPSRRRLRSPTLLIMASRRRESRRADVRVESLLCTSVVTNFGGQRFSAERLGRRIAVSKARCPSSYRRAAEGTSGGANGRVVELGPDLEDVLTGRALRSVAAAIADGGGVLFGRNLVARVFARIRIPRG